MEVQIKINRQNISVGVSDEVGEFLDQARHKSENSSHKKRRHWDGRKIDEYIVAHECSGSYYENTGRLALLKGNFPRNYGNRGKQNGSAQIAAVAVLAAVLVGAAVWSFKLRKPGKKDKNRPDPDDYDYTAGEKK